MAEKSPNLMAVSLVAGLAGALTALLLAPRSGTDTRKMLHDQADEMKDRTQESLHGVKDSVHSGLERFSSALNTSKKKMKEDYDELSDRKDYQAKRQSPVLNAWEEEV